jgi:hypothetical protein
MRKINMKISADLVFQSWNGALAGADALEAVGYEVEISFERLDPYSGAAFAEAYKVIDSHEQEDACWEEIDAIIQPFHGICEGLGEADDVHST